MTKPIAFVLLFFVFCLVNIFSQNVAPSEIKSLCDQVAQIKRLPHYDERGVDIVYDTMAEADEAVIPCLIEKITDTKIMPDPRCPVIYTETKVGDVAYFVLVSLTKIGFTELFPAEVKKKYKTNGVYSYHEYIESKGKRKELQTKFQEWYRQKQRKQQ